MNRLMDKARLAVGGGCGEGVGGRYGESNMETYNAICKIANENLPCDSGNSNQGSVITWRGGMGREVGGMFKWEGHR